MSLLVTTECVNVTEDVSSGTVTHQLAEAPGDASGLTGFSVSFTAPAQKFGLGATVSVTLT